MAKLAAQLKDKFCGLVGRITSCGRAGHKDAAGAKDQPNSASSQRTEIRSRGPPPRTSPGSKPPNN